MKLLMGDLRSLAGKIEELTAGCPMQGCGVGKDGELGALWRRWVSLRRGLGLLMAHTEQRQEEWKDITTSVSTVTIKSFLLCETFYCIEKNETLLLSETDAHKGQRKTMYR